MRVLFFLASGILEDGSVAFFHMNLSVFWNRMFFSMKVLFFLLQAFWKTVLSIFSYEFIRFFETELFFQ